MAGLDLRGSITAVPIVKSVPILHHRLLQRLVQSSRERSVCLGRPNDADLARFLLSASSSLSRSQTRALRLACRAAATATPGLQQQIDDLKQLREDLTQAHTPANKVDLLMALPLVQTFCGSADPVLMQHLSKLPAADAALLLYLPAMGQSHVLAAQGASAIDPRAALQSLVTTLAAVDTFYDSIGGLLGYQLKCLQILHTEACSVPDSDRDQAEQSSAELGNVQYHMPRGPDLAGPNGAAVATEAVATGLQALPHLAEIYPLGGAGDRLGLKCEVTGTSIPTAMLPYCGRTLLEGLVRDLQAREFLYWKLNGRQVVSPVAIMTSDAKGNHQRVQQILGGFNWFGRGQNNFRLFRQPMVPMVAAEDGHWLMSGTLQPMLKPGGHGAIWKLMHDQGVFDWLSQHTCEAAIVRQISNPMAGMDATLLALAGTGYADSRSFGFASCERAVGAAEGMNVLAEHRLQRPGGGTEWGYNVTNIEYTEFERLGVTDQPAEGSQFSRFPANTNVLYIGLKAAELAVKAGVASGGGAALPGLMMNLNKTYKDKATGQEQDVRGGRLECAMQNLVDSLSQRFDEPVPMSQHASLDTFVVYNKRRRVTSSAKRKLKPGSSSLSQTPDGSFRDLMLNAHDLLRCCGFLHLPEVGEVQQYLRKGPGFIFLWHPSLGPLWDIIAQKVTGGALAPGAELILEVAEASVVDLRVDGSLIVESDSVMGQPEPALPVGSNAIRPRDQQLANTDLWYTQPEPMLPAGTPDAVPLHMELSRFTGAPTTQEPAQKAHHSPAPRTIVAGSNERLVYSHRCGRVRLRGVSVRNAGIDWEAPGNVYWQHKVHRREAVRIILHGQSEFEASHVVLQGSHTFEVLDGYKMVVSAGPNDSIRTALFPLINRQPSWEWNYSQAASGRIRLELQEGSRHSLLSPDPLADLPFSYVI
ncbi:hypothetical protein WJX74_006343 [Apatococcus lobatus]|uniref:UGP3-like C-terminal hexapeptide repeats domain-containing protein n=1 Tax=Apatococcus lobatus TaxID=904363 RepID=A0AAW1RGY8_9CHLO